MDKKLFFSSKRKSEICNSLKVKLFIAFLNLSNYSQVNKILKAVKMNIASKYAYVMTFTFVAMAFSTSFPAVLPALSLFLFLTFWIEKYRSK